MIGGLSMKKRVLSIILSLCIIMTLLPVPSFAASDGWRFFNAEPVRANPRNVTINFNAPTSFWSSDPNYYKHYIRLVIDYEEALYSINWIPYEPSINFTFHGWADGRHTMYAIFGSASKSASSVYWNNVYFDSTPPVAWDVYQYDTKGNRITSMKDTDLSFQIKGLVQDPNPADGTFGSGVEGVHLYTWTNKNGHDDMKKAVASYNWTTKEFICSIPLADHNNESGVYNTTVYTIDKLGNSKNVGTWVMNVIDTTPPTATGITTPNPFTRDDSYTVYAEGVADPGSGIARVQFPTWTIANGQDDIIWHEGIYDATSDRWSVNINKSNHKNETGAYTTHAYAYDGAGNVAFIGNTSVTIDQTPPTITGISTPRPFTNTDSFTLYAVGIADSQSGVGSVSFPVWTAANGQDDTRWYPGTYDGASSRWFVNVNKRDHNNETGHYVADAYAYDRVGNFDGIGRASVIIDQTPPTITRLTTSNGFTNADSFTVYAEGVADSQSGIDRVRFPTWTIANGQDDIIWHEGIYDAASGRWFANVNKSSHKNETGVYTTHVYAYDKAGNVKGLASAVVTIDQTPPTAVSITTPLEVTSADTYTVYANEVTDLGSGIDWVRFPTWTIAHGQDDLIWHEGLYDAASGRWFANIDKSDHRNETGTYETHAYASDKAGNEAQIGENIIVTILQTPTVTTAEDAAIGTTTFTLGGSIIVDGGASVSERGIVYSKTNKTPTIESDAQVIAESGIGDFSVDVGPLDANNIYYARAYAINSVGIGYGNTVSFTTFEGDIVSKPTVTIESDITSPTNAASIPITITFSEPVTGFDINDITISNGSSDGFSGSAGYYTLNIIPSSDGEVIVSINADIAFDEAENGNEAADPFTIETDLTPPNVAVVDAYISPQDNSVILSIAFNEVVNGLKLSDFDILNGVATNLLGSGKVYTTEIIPDSDGSVEFGIKSGAGQDAAGNGSSLASYEFSTYSLNYHPGEKGVLVGNQNQRVLEGASGTDVSIIVAEGYRFEKWSDGVTTLGRIDSNVTGSIDVTATYLVNEYTLIYTGGDNGSLVGAASQTVNHGSAGTAVTAQPDEGFRFLKWSDGSTANPRIDTDVMVDISVTAEFVESSNVTLTYTVTAGSNGSIDGVGSQTVGYKSDGETVTAIPNAGYIFVGWSDGSTANPRRDTHVTNDISVAAEFAEYTTMINYVSADLDGGLVSTANESIASATGIASGSTATAYEGYSFINWTWFDREVGTGLVFIPAKNSSEIYELATYRANFAPNIDTVYKVEHYLENLNEDSYILMPADTDNLKGTTRTPTVASAKTYPGFTKPIFSQETIAADGSTVIKLYYPRELYQVIFNSNGGTLIDSQTIEYGGTIIEPSTPTKAGYTFDGWFKESNTDSVWNVAADKVTGNITLYAKWMSNDSGSSGSGNTTIATTTAVSTGNTTTATTTATAIVDDSGKATATLTQAQVSEVVNKAVEEVAKQGNGMTAVVEIKVVASAAAKAVEVSLSKAAVDEVAGSNVAVTISTPIAAITFDAKALDAISAQAAADVMVSAAKVDTKTLSKEDRKLVGDRPVYNFSVTSGDITIFKFGGNVTVALPYTPKPAEDTNAIVIYYINPEGNLEIVSNCKYDLATGTIRFTTDHFSEYAIGYNKVRFNDVLTNAWYSQAVGFIAARSITVGTGSGNYTPEAKLTRAQFLIMLMRAYGMNPNTDLKDNFADAGDTYYTDYLATAKQLGISKGVGNNLFAPDKQITRQEMFTMLYNGLEIIERLPRGNSGKTLSDFTDSELISPWAHSAMKLLVETGTIGGSDRKLNPADTTTRAEMAQVLYNLLSK